MATVQASEVTRRYGAVTALDAVSSAVEMQLALADPLEGLELKVRMGVHDGIAALRRVRDRVSDHADPHDGHAASEGKGRESEQDPGGNRGEKGATSRVHGLVRGQGRGGRIPRDWRNSAVREIVAS